MKKLAVALLSLSLLASCSSDEGSSSNATSQTTTPATSASTETTQAPSIEGGTYSYSFLGAEITLGTNFSVALDSLGEPSEYFEAPSCAFDGLDKIYYYNGVEVRTYPQGDDDYVSTILLKDDTVTTPEGAYIGMDIAEVLEKHGDAYTVDGSQYIYMSGEASLIFIVQNDSVIAINYSLPDV